MTLFCCPHLNWVLLSAWQHSEKTSVSALIQAWSRTSVTNARWHELMGWAGHTARVPRNLTHNKSREIVLKGCDGSNTLNLRHGDSDFPSIIHFIEVKILQSWCALRVLVSVGNKCQGKRQLGIVSLHQLVGLVSRTNHPSWFWLRVRKLRCGLWWLVVP